MAHHTCGMKFFPTERSHAPISAMLDLVRTTTCSRQVEKIQIRSLAARATFFPIRASTSATKRDSRPFLPYVIAAALVIAR